MEIGKVHAGERHEHNPMSLNISSQLVEHFPHTALHACRVLLTGHGTSKLSYMFDIIWLSHAVLRGFLDVPYTAFIVDSHRALLTSLSE